jgi:hypothetical protein
MVGCKILLRTQIGSFPWTIEFGKVWFRADLSRSQFKTVWKIKDWWEWVFEIFIFISVYSFYGGHSLLQFWIGLHCTLLTLHQHLSPHSSLLHLIARGFIILFHICTWSPSTTVPHLNLLYSLSPHPIYYTYFMVPSFIINSKSVFKGISRCIPSVSILYFDQFNPFHYSPLPLPSHSLVSISFRYISLHPLPSQMLYISILLMLCHSLLMGVVWEKNWEKKTAHVENYWKDTATKGKKERIGEYKS